MKSGIQVFSDVLILIHLTPWNIIKHVLSINMQILFPRSIKRLFVNHSLATKYNQSWDLVSSEYGV